MAMSRKQIMYLYATGVFKRLPAGMKASKSELKGAGTVKKTGGKSSGGKSETTTRFSGKQSINEKKGYSKDTIRKDRFGVTGSPRITTEFTKEVKKIEKLPPATREAVAGKMNSNPNRPSVTPDKAVAQLRHDYDQLPAVKRDSFRGGFKQFAETYAGIKDSTPARASTSKTPVRETSQSGNPLDGKNATINTAKGYDAKTSRMDRFGVRGNLTPTKEFTAEVKKIEKVPDATKQAIHERYEQYSKLKPDQKIAKLRWLYDNEPPEKKKGFKSYLKGVLK